MKGRDFIFDSIQPMYYKFQELSFIGGGSYTDFSDWRKNKQ